MSDFFDLSATSCLLDFQKKKYDLVHLEYNRSLGRGDKATSMHEALLPSVSTAIAIT
ncbi:uncharacterized protein CLUP02_10238 [Colletotrichum lupini]|uniref:Uncharacterized protein n=1 Tax=Colletotrichum lupini TaxID=145971 RepID=A0A9Q8WJ64_9PEZI|nr:uncharacterized protein CLUP02_10238 [Colletotrichum lupini]UQC84742.1 hypothetical protein CLUP02_10238 [Colletotrichum lupini]